jgi:hypothetical protein
MIGTELTWRTQGRDPDEYTVPDAGDAPHVADRMQVALK